MANLPAIPSPEFVGLYTMFYRHSAVGNHLITKNFRCSGSLKEARDRAEKHCAILGAKLNFVNPLIANLQTEEEFILKGGLKDLSTLVEVKS